MKIITAFDSFKGSLTAMEACQTAASGIRNAQPDAEIVMLPMSDGGEGMVSCLSNALGLKTVDIEVTGPLHEPVTAHYALSPDSHRAYMEMAEAAGLMLVPQERRDPTRTTTYGVGEMIIDAAKRGCKEIVMGIGGSATCDGGRGMVECLRRTDMVLPQIIVASDVNNPLCGEHGAAHVFAPQKGATPQQVMWLDNQLLQFAQETAEAGIAPLSLMEQPGAGAAGGLGFGLMAYLHAELHSGIDLMLDLLDFDHALAGASLVFTGEGKSDAQTLMGKVAAGVLQRARHKGVPCHLLSGCIEEKDLLLQAGFSSVRSIHEGDNRPIGILMQKQETVKNMINAISQRIYYQSQN